MKVDTKLAAAERVIVGFRGTSLSADHWIIEQIAEHGLGGVILYGRNIVDPEQLAALCQQLRSAAAGRDLVIAIDQEGGAVSRLTEGNGFLECPSAYELGRGAVEGALRFAAEQAAQLADLGITLNFAPSVDLFRDGSYIAAAGRSYGSDPRLVTEYAAAVVEMHRKAGVCTCLKHFPGHGSSSGDTHRGVVDVTDTWSNDELVPYRKLVESGHAEMVMLGHVIHRKIAEAPLSLSGQGVLLLRSDLGYQGPIITDDLQMDAIAANYSLEESVQLSDEAGVDWLLFANHANDDQLLGRVVAALCDGAAKPGR